MPDFDTPSQVLEFAKDAEEADRDRKGDLERTCLIGVMYYGGQQWARLAGWPNRMGISRLQTDWDPDSAKLRVTTNRVARLIQKATVTTFPEKIEAEVFPPDRDASPDAVLRAQVYEYALAAGMDAARFVAACRNANFHRSIWGSYGIGVRLRFKKRKLSLYGSEVEAADSDMSVFDFPVTDLTLDPACSDRDLRGHEFVIHRSIWSQQKVREWLGIDLADGDLKTVGDLAKFQMSANEITENQLYARYKSMSRVKGAIVKQVHVRDDSGRFGRMFLILETDANDGEVLNWDNPESPFGGCGLPLALLHGHRRSDGPFGLSDASMLKDDQDKLNLSETFKHRGAQAHTQWTWRWDRNTIGRQGGDEEAVRDSLNNQVGGVVFWTSGTRDRPGQPPELVSMPPVPSHLFAMAREYEEAMMEQVHRAPINSGVTKSHVPNQVVQAAIDQSDQVLGARVREDVDTYEHVADVILGTTIRQVREMSPRTLGMLRKRGFNDEDLGILAQADPNDCGCSVKVRDSSVRFQSPAAKRQALVEAVTAQAIDAGSFRLALARDTDMALTGDDRYYADCAARAAARVLRGEEWQAISLGSYSYMFIEAFQRAQLSDPARRDPEALRRLDSAVQSQRMRDAQDMAVMQAAMQPQAASGAPAGGEAQPSPDDAFGDVVAALEGQGAAA